MRPTRAAKFAISILLFSAVTLIFGTTALAQLLRPEFPAVDKQVYAIATAGNTIYIGGQFDYVGNQTGMWVPVSAATGDTIPGFAKVWGATNGYIWDAVPDGAGGWFIGGLFGEVGGQSRANLAHIEANGTVSPWNPGTDNHVLAMAIDGGILYVGGSFNTAGGLARSRLAAIDAVTGAVTAWDPDPQYNATVGVIREMAVGASAVYIGGQFTDVGGAMRNSLAAIDKATGLATAWDANATFAGPSGVGALEVDGSLVYIGGGFTNIGGAARNDLAALDATTAVATTWNPNPTSASRQIRDIAVAGNTVYVGGNFVDMGGLTRRHVAAIDATTGAVTAFDADVPQSGGSIFVLEVDGSTLYLGGAFTEVGGETRHHVAAVAAVTGAVTPWNPCASEGVEALGISGSTVFIGGHLGTAYGDFFSVNAAPRKNLAALDATTGAILDWDPSTNSRVEALAVDGSTVYAGGLFTSVGGVTRFRIAALDAVTGLATAWDPNASGTVYALTLDGSSVYAGGQFTTIGGASRSRIAELDAVTGLATTWDPNASNTVHVIAVDGSTVYAGGLFTTIGGAARNNLAALDAVTGLASAWNPDPIGGLPRAIEPFGSKVYVGGQFTTIGGAARNRIAALDPVTGLATPWDPSASSSVYAVAPTLSTVYAGGSFSSMGGQTRNLLAAIDATTGVPAGWDPDLFVAPFHALELGTSYVYAGGFFRTVGGESHPGFAVLEPAGPLVGNIVGAENAECISTANACVAVPVTITRTDATGVRGFSVTLALSAELALCGAGIVEGTYLSDIGTTSFQVLDAGGGIYTVDGVILGNPCGATAASGTLFTLNLGSAAASATGTVTVTNVLLRDCNNEALTVAAGPAADVPIDNTVPSAVLNAAQVKSGNDGDGTTQIQLSWTGTAVPGDSVFIYRTSWGDYPEYDDVGGSAPAAPSLPPGAPWTEVATVIAPLAAYTDDPGPRDFWYYAAFVKDPCGNVSAVTGPTTGTLNYHLGDVHNGGAACQGDNAVSTSDISFLGANYGITLGAPPDVLACLDVGPTSDFSVDGRPTTDNQVQFEDLVMFGLNYEVVAGARLALQPAPLERDALTLVGPEQVAAGETFTVSLQFAGSGAVRALSARLAWNEAVAEPVAVAAGALAEAQDAVVLSATPGTVDAAGLGRGLTGEGELATVTFRARVAGNPAVTLGSLDARDQANRRVTLGAIRPEQTTVTALMPALPNPFGQSTTLAFALARGGAVELSIFGVDGRRVATLVRETRSAGVHRVTWNGTDAAGHALGAGIYFVRLRTPEGVFNRSLVRVR